MLGERIITLRTGWLPLLIFFLMQAFGIFVGNSLAPLAPFLVVDLGLTRSQVGLFTSFLYLGALIIGFPAGLLADQRGVRFPLTLGGLLTGIFFGTIAGINVYWLMLILVFLGGLGYGIINPVTSKGVINWFDVNSRGTAMAIKQVGFTAGGIMAGGILPFIATIYNWRASLAIAGIVLIIWSLVSYAIYHDPPKSYDVYYDLPKEESKQKSKAKLTNLGTMLNHEIISISVYGIFFAALQHIGITYLALYFVESFGFTKIAAGGMLVLTQVGGTLGRLFWGWASDLYFPGRRKTVMLVMGFIGSFITILLGLMQSPTLPIILGVITFLFGFMIIGHAPVFLTMVSEIVNKEVAGAATGFCITIAYLGIFFGPPLFGLMVDLSKSYTRAWISFGTVLALASIIFSQVKLNILNEK